MSIKHVTASELRSNIYRLLDEVLETGEPLGVRRRTGMLRISRAHPVSKLDRLVRRDDVICGDPADLVHMDWSGEWQP